MIVYNLHMIRLPFTLPNTIFICYEARPVRLLGMKAYLFESQSNPPYYFLSQSPGDFRDSFMMWGGDNEMFDSSTNGDRNTDK